MADESKSSSSNDNILSIRASTANPHTSMPPSPLPSPLRPSATSRGEPHIKDGRRINTTRVHASAIVAIILALLASKALLYLAVSTAQDSVSYNNPIAGQIIGNFTRLFLIVGAFLFLRVKSIGLLAKERLFCAIVLYCAASIIWSSYPQGSFTSIYRFTPFVIVGLWVISDANRPSIFNKMTSLCRAIIYANILSIILFPSLAFMHGIHEGAMRGVFPTKNVLGLNLVLCLSLFIPAVLERRTIHRIFDLAVTIALLGLTQSITSYMCAAVIVSTSFGSILIRALVPGRHQRIALALAAALALPALFIISLPLVERALGLFGRDLTFTGRSSIWNFAIQAIHDRPWFGYGFRAFWQDPDNNLVGRGVIFFAHSHNGYIDAWLDGGILEFGLLIALFASLAYRSVETALSDQRNLSIHVFPMLVAVTVITHNLAETSFPFDVYITPVFVIAASVFCRLKEKDRVVSPKRVTAPKTGGTTRGTYPHA